MDEQKGYARDPQDESARGFGAPREQRATDDIAETGPVAPVPSAAGPYAEHTRPLPPATPDTGQLPPLVGPFYGTPEPASPAYQGASGATTTFQGTQRTRSARGLTAAVLVGAIVLGGAAGVGGAAVFDALHNDGSGTSPSSSSNGFQATKTAVLPNGTVEKVANAVLPSVVKVNVKGQSGEGSGSGIVLSKDGKILTNNHVVTAAGNGGSISVNFNDGTTKKATVIGTDPMTDIAVIEVKGANGLAPAALGQSGSLRVGQTVVAVGSPYGLNATVTSGIVSALNRPVSVSTQDQQQDPFGGLPNQGQGQSQSMSTTYPAIQTDAAINPGNSGGPLVDLSGRVVGINSSIRTASDSTGLSGASGGSIGLGFAIPIDEVLPIVNQINAGDKPTHARLGVSVSDAAGQTLQGAQLQNIEKGGAADRAGLKNGDVITKVDGQVINGSESLVATIRGHRPAEKVQITFVRNGQTSTVTADLGTDANNQAS